MAIKTTGPGGSLRDTKETVGIEADRMDALTRSFGMAQAAYEAHTLAQMIYGHIASTQMRAAWMPIPPGYETMPSLQAAYAMPPWNVMWPTPPSMTPSGVRMVPLSGV